MTCFAASQQIPPRICLLGVPVEESIEVARSVQNTDNLDAVLERPKEDEVIAKSGDREATQTRMGWVSKLAVAPDAGKLSEHRDGLFESVQEAKSDVGGVAAKVDGALFSIGNRQRPSDDSSPHTHFLPGALLVIEACSHPLAQRAPILIRPLGGGPGVDALEQQLLEVFLSGVLLAGLADELAYELAGRGVAFARDLRFDERAKRAWQRDVHGSRSVVGIHGMILAPVARRVKLCHQPNRLWRTREARFELDSARDKNWVITSAARHAQHHPQLRP